MDTNGRTRPKRARFSNTIESTVDMDELLRIGLSMDAKIAEICLDFDAKLAALSSSVDVRIQNAVNITKAQLLIMIGNF